MSREGYFNLFKHLCLVDFLAAAPAVVLLSWDPVGGGPPALLVLGAFFASFVFAARGMTRVMAGIGRPPGWGERSIRILLALAVGSLLVGMAGVTLSAVMLFAL